MSHQQAIDLPCCAECGMPCSPTEFHPFAACLMFKGCHDSDKVRANLEFLADRSRSAAPVAVPEGFVLVPREPTEAMILAGAGTRGMKAIDDSCTTMQLRGYSIDPEAFKGGAPLAQAWRAMLAAAPLATPLAPAETGLELDAKRYRFLAAEAYECVIPNGGTLNGKRSAWITKLHPGKSFNEAIDAALAAPPGLAPLVAGVGEVL